MSYMKVVPGDPAYLVDFPAACICGAQKGPMVATGQTVNMGGGDLYHIYICRLCGTQIGRALGLVKGDEFTRLQNAADELAVLVREVSTRQEIIDRQTKSLGENEAKITQQRGYIESLQGEVALFRAQANQIAATAREMAAV